ncbi:uncharacterized protein LOC111865644 [Cryptotermes secundus]|uniref:uncharacterized protein LOC111865644 n=1 Tax=Cryptotermes secundus TaxID=105785 RepID=UPI000CD7B720|nr:uncharacterized protein LOC111865644 [Cryptotermes secundus]
MRHRRSHSGCSISEYSPQGCSAVGQHIRSYSFYVIIGTSRREADEQISEKDFKLQSLLSEMCSDWKDNDKFKKEQTGPSVDHGKEIEQEETDKEARKQKKRKIDAEEDTTEGTAEPSHLERKDDSKKDTVQVVAGEERKSVGTSHQRRKRKATQDSDSTITCPVSKIPERRCNWVGTLDSLHRHVTCDHWGIYRSGPIFRCGSFQNKVLLILFNQEIFLYYKHVTYTGIVYAVVQQVGVTNKEFKYTIKLRAEDETVENITFSFKTEKTSEPLEIIFDARRCMAMTDESLIPFVAKHELNMTVKISETATHSDRPTEVTKGVNTGKRKKMRAHQEEKAGSVAKGDVKTTSAVTCPLLKIPQYSCDWAGSLKDLEAHVIQHHARILIQSNVFQCSALEHKVLLILFNKEIFLYYKYISTGGVTYVIVQQVGVTREKYSA